MRRLFKQILLEKARQDPRIVLLTGDMGYGMWDDFKKELPERFVNCGAAEQSMLDAAVGLAMAGKIPVAYSITPFLIYRGFETLRTYITHEGWHVILAGSGRDRDYKHDGYSHDACDVSHILAALEGIKQLFPQTPEDVPKYLQMALEAEGPVFLSLRR